MNIRPMYLWIKKEDIFNLTIIYHNVFSNYGPWLDKWTKKEIVIITIRLNIDMVT